LSGPTLHPAQEPLRLDRVQPSSREVRESSGSTDPKAARRLLRARRDEIGRERTGGHRFVGPQGERIRTSELLDGLEADYRTRGKLTPQVRSHLAPIRTHFGGWRAAELRDRDVLDYIEARRRGNPDAEGTVDRKGRADATVNRELQLLGQALRYGAAKYALPVPTIPKLSEKHNVRRGFFEKADFEAVANALPDEVVDVARFGYFSSWRRGEILQLTWSDVDRAAGEIHLRAKASKNRQARTLPMDTELATLIERRWQARMIRQPDGSVPPPIEWTPS
jgi:integrase